MVNPLKFLHDLIDFGGYGSIRSRFESEFYDTNSDGIEYKYDQQKDCYYYENQLMFGFSEDGKPIEYHDSGAFYFHDCVEMNLKPKTNQALKDIDELLFSLPDYKSKAEFMATQLNHYEQKVNTNLYETITPQGEIANPLLEAITTLQAEITQKHLLNNLPVSSKPLLFKLRDRKKTDFIKILNALVEENYFQNIHDTDAPDKKVVFAFFADILKGEFSQSLSQAFKGSRDTYLKPFNDLVWKTELLYDEHQEKALKQNK